MPKKTGRPPAPPKQNFQKKISAQNKMLRDKLRRKK